MGDQVIDSADPAEILGMQVAAESAKLKEAVAAAEQELEAELSRLGVEEAALRVAAGCVEEEMGALEEAQASLGSARRACAGRKEELAQVQFLQEARQVGLLSELKLVFPIERTVSGEFSIRGVELPRVSELSTSPKDDELVSSALGYTVHVLMLCSKYLKVPLRYHMYYQSSRSTIRDPLLHGGSAYPLYRKGIERERFEKAIILLQRNVSQLVQSRGLFFDPSKDMLENLKQIYPCDVCTSLATL